MVDLCSVAERIRVEFRAWESVGAVSRRAITCPDGHEENPSLSSERCLSTSVHLPSIANRQLTCNKRNNSQTTAILLFASRQAVTSSSTEDCPLDD